MNNGGPLERQYQKTFNTKQTLIKKAKELGLHLGYNNKLEEFIDFSLGEVKKVCEELQISSSKSIDKLEEKTEQDRMTNLLNENMVFGYQIALRDIISKLSEVDYKDKQE